MRTAKHAKNAKKKAGMFQILALLLLVLCFPAISVGAQKNEQKISHNLGKEKVTVVPDTMLRGYDPITVFFPGNRGPAGGGPLDNPGSLLRIRPIHPGEYKWVDSKTLQFLPTTPWPALERYTISVENQAFEVSTLMAPPRQISPPHGSNDLEPIDEFNLSFADRIDVQKLALMVTFEVRPLPGVSQEKGYWLTAKDFAIKEMERAAIDDPVRYRITLHKPLPYGMRITLDLRLSLDSSIPGSLAQYTFSTKPLFRLNAVGSDTATYPVASEGSVYPMEQAMDCGTGKAQLLLKFNDYLNPVSVNEIKRMVRFNPSVRNLHHEVSGKTIRLLFDADREKAYQLNLQHVPIRSQSSRKLAAFGPTSVYFFFRQSGSYLKWLAAKGILERYGPQVFPMEGRNMDQVDLRIYKINPLNRNFWPFPSQAIEVDESSRPKGPGEEPAYATAMKEQIKLLGSPLVSQVVPLPLKTGTGGIRFGIDLKEHLNRISGPNRPGTYLVGYRTIGTSTQRQYVRVQVTDLSLSTVEEESAVTFVVTSLTSGSPISNATIKVEGIDKGEWVTVFSGVTDSNGIFRYSHTNQIEKQICRIFVRHGEDTLVLDPDNPPPHFMNNHWYNSYSRWLNWLNNIPRHEKSDYVSKAHILTERPVYRPEEEVHIKGYVRLRQQGKIKPDTRSHRRSVIVQGPGNKQWTYPVTLTPYGSFYHKFDEKDLPTGEYRAIIKDETDNLNLATVDFKKESYRIPRFEVQLSGPDRVALDEPFEITMTAGYYAGGPVVGQSVYWQVTQFPYHYLLPGYEGFLFSSDERFSGRSPSRTSATISKTDVTDDKGIAAITIDPTLEEDSRSRNYVVEATVRGADEQTVTATRSVLALSPFVLGLKLERFLSAGMTIQPQVIVVGIDEKPLAGKEFHLRLMQRQWHSHLQESDFTTGKAKYVTDVVDETIFEADYLSEASAKTLSLPVKEAGVYVVEISARDRQGRLQKVQADLYVAGDTPVAWKKPRANVFETTADKLDYLPGDTAAIVLKSPFQEAHALVVVEGPTANTYHWVQVRNGQGIFRLSIKGDMTPRVPVHFLLMRGRLPGKTNQLQAGREDRAKPIAMANTIWLSVKPKDNQLELSLDHPKKNLPGAKIKMAIKMTDPDGRPLNGEVTLWLVDRAVLALGKEKPLDPLPSFIDPVTSMLRIRETRNEVVGNLSQEEIEGGDVGEAEEEPSIFERVTVRKTFKTVPYFNPGIQVTNGTVTVEIELPDNLTDFAVRAVATDGSGRFGAVKSMLSIRLPLIVQSALPRFVRPGDDFMAGGIGRVVEGEGGPGKAELQVKGLEVKGDTKYPVRWVIGQPEKVFFPLKVPEDAADKKEAAVTVRLAVIRDTDQAMDAFEVQLPVRRDKESRTLEKFVTVQPRKVYSLPVPDETVRPGTMKQTLLITSEPALVKMLAGLDYLARYEHGCTEQRLSKLLPELALKDMMSRIGREIHTHTMKQVMDDTFTFLEGCLNPNGLYSCWPGSTGYVNLTAYVVEFLLEARNQGYPFKDKLLDRGIAALKESLRTDYRYFIQGSSFVERAEALTALAKANYFDDAYAHDLMARALNMDLYSEAKILYTFLDQEKTYEKAVNRLSQDLWKSLVFKLRDGKEAYEGLQYRSQSWGGLILASEVKTMANVARALYKAEPDNPRVRLLVDELVNLGTGDGWGSTNANAAALVALGEVLGHPKPQKEGYKLEVTFGSNTRKIDTKNQVVTRVTSTDSTPGSFKLLSDAGEKNPLAWLVVEYVPGGTGDKIKARNEGFVVMRELMVYKDKDQPPAKYTAEAGKTLTLEMGTVVEEHIRVINSEKRFYAAIKAPFAAGLEPLNPNLATAPPEATPSGTFTRNPDYAIYADDAVTFYFDTLPKGTYDFYFRLRSSIEGRFTHPAAKAELMYQLAVRGNSDGTRVVVKGRE
jgi:uncharacterized protein YfaS (alpha-2-macroglobulin family)